MIQMVWILIATKLDGIIITLMRIGYIMHVCDFELYE